MFMLKSSTIFTKNKLFDKIVEFKRKCCLFVGFMKILNQK